MQTVHYGSDNIYCSIMCTPFSVYSVLFPPKLVLFTLLTLVSQTSTPQLSQNSFNLNCLRLLLTPMSQTSFISKVILSLLFTLKLSQTSFNSEVVFDRLLFTLKLTLLLTLISQTSFNSKVVSDLFLLFSCLSLVFTVKLFQTSLNSQVVSGFSEL